MSYFCCRVSVVHPRLLIPLENTHITQKKTDKIQEEVILFLHYNKHAWTTRIKAESMQYKYTHRHTHTHNLMIHDFLSENLIDQFVFDACL